MSYGEPNTEIWLAKVPFDSTYRNTIKFSTKTEQLNFFKTSVSNWHITGDYDFIDGRGEGEYTRIKLPIHAEEAQKYNYVFYTNKDPSSLTNNQWTYCFIVGQPRFINYECCEVTVTTDKLQTYMFSYSVQSCLIEQETVANTKVNRRKSYFPALDTPYDVARETSLFDREGFYYYIAVTEAMILPDTGAWVNYPADDNDDWHEIGKCSGGCKVNTTELGIYFIICENAKEVSNILRRHESTEEFDMKNVITTGMISKQIAHDPHRIWATGSTMVSFTAGTRYWVKGDGVHKYALQSECTADAIHEKTFTRGTTLDRGNYTPINNCMLIYPFSFPRINAGGKSLDLRWENCGTEGTLTIGFSYYFSDKWHCVAYPKDYMQQGANTPCYDKFIEIPISTSIPWTSDLYLRYMQQSRATREEQSGANIGSMAVGAAQIIGGIAIAVATEGAGTAAAAPLIMGGVGSVATGISGEVKQAQSNDIVKAGAGKELIGVIGDDIMLLQEGFKPYLQTIQVRQEMLVNLDKNISVYGYPVNKWDKPAPMYNNVWSYIKCKNCFIKPAGTSGDPYMTDQTVKDIERIYINGFTYWTPGAAIGDYEFYNYKNEIPTED